MFLCTIQTLPRSTHRRQAGPMLSFSKLTSPNFQLSYPTAVRRRNLHELCLSAVPPSTRGVANSFWFVSVFPSVWLATCAAFSVEDHSTFIAYFPISHCIQFNEFE